MTETAAQTPDNNAVHSEGPDAITWTASEFVAHAKTTGWYVNLAIAAMLISAVVYLITRDVISVGVVVAAAILLGVYGSHQPRELEYHLNQHGLTIGHKNYHYDDFRCFSIVPEGAFSSIVFMPLRRFSPPLSIYYAPDDEEKILNVLSVRLPFEEGHRDAVESLMRRIRF